MSLLSMNENRPSQEVSTDQKGLRGMPLAFICE